MSDFLHWGNDIDLDVLLEEYTDSREGCEESPSKLKKKRKEPSYKCPVCLRVLKTIAGFRGHTARQHNRTDIKATEHKTQAAVVPPERSSVTENDLTTIVANTLKVMEADKILHRDSGLMSCVAASLTNSSLRETLHSTIWPSFQQHALSTSLQRETLFSSLFQLSIDLQFRETMIEQFLGHGILKDRYVINFLVNFLHQAVGELAKFQSMKSKSLFTSFKTEITSNDHRILGYIAGYLTVKIHGEEVMEVCSSSTPTSDWIEKTTRGGLTYPSSLFTDLVYMEGLLRAKVDMGHLTARSLDVPVLLEMCMTDHHLQDMAEDLQLSSHVLEDIIKLFLTVRGFATARKERNRLLGRKYQGKKSASLRQALKELSCANNS